MNSDINIRNATPEDAAACARVVFDAFGGIAQAHNFPLDFPVPEMTLGFMQMLCGNPKFYGVVAANGRIKGCNFLDQRDAISAVGPMTVDPHYQSQGIGRALMNQVIEKWKSTNSPGIRLVQDAFNTASMSLYASLGFEVKEPLVLMTGRPKNLTASAGKVLPVTVDDIAECATLCNAVHGFDRANELRDAIEPFKPMLLRKDGKVVAYASAPHFWFLNHGVAASEQDMIDLLSGIAGQSQEPLALLVPTRQASFFRWCLSQGLRVVKPLSLMAMGEYHEPKGTFYCSVAY